MIQWQMGFGQVKLCADKYFSSSVGSFLSEQFFSRNFMSRWRRPSAFCSCKLDVPVKFHRGCIRGNRPTSHQCNIAINLLWMVESVQIVALFPQPSYSYASHQWWLVTNQSTIFSAATKFMRFEHVQSRHQSWSLSIYIELHNEDNTGFGTSFVCVTLSTFSHLGQRPESVDVYNMPVGLKLSNTVVQALLHSTQTENPL